MRVLCGVIFDPGLSEKDILDRVHLIFF